MGEFEPRLVLQLVFQPLAETLLTPTETAVLWGLHHPYWLIAITISLVICLQVTLSLTGQLLRRFLKEISRSPLSLGRWLFSKTTTQEMSQEQQIETIIKRLDSLQDEQAALLRELKKMLPKGD